MINLLMIAITDFALPAILFITLIFVIPLTLLLLYDFICFIHVYLRLKIIELSYLIEKIEKGD